MLLYKKTTTNHVRKDIYKYKKKSLIENINVHKIVKHSLVNVPIPSNV